MKHGKLTYVAQVIAGSILAMAAAAKFMDAPESVAVFSALEMEPFGRYLIGFIELTAAIALLSPFAATGSVIALAVMSGALIAHCTALGFMLHKDGGSTMGMLITVLICAAYVLKKRRREIPFVGNSLG